MAAVKNEDVSFEFESPPKSCLELLRLLRELEAFVDAKIESFASWPQVERTRYGTRRIAFPLLKYRGPTQSLDEAVSNQHQARTVEFAKLEHLLPQMFDSVGLIAPDIQPLGTDVEQAKRFLSDFWVRVSLIIQAEAFKRKELVPNWAPQVLSCWSRDQEPLANEKVYPSYPIRSLNDVEKWLIEWSERCNFPESPKPEVIYSTLPRFEIRTIEIPQTRPPFEKPIKRLWRCSLDDLAREIRNFRRACTAWKLEPELHWEGDPNDFPTAEDRLSMAIASVRRLRHSAFTALCDSGYSEFDVGNCAAEEIPELLAGVRLNTLEANSADKSKVDLLRQKHSISDNDLIKTRVFYSQKAKEGKKVTLKSIQTLGFGSDKSQAIRVIMRFEGLDTSPPKRSRRPAN